MIRRTSVDAWSVRLVGQHEGDWTAGLRRALMAVQEARAAGRRHERRRRGRWHRRCSSTGVEMIVEYIRYHIAEERRAGFEDAYAQAAQALSRSPQCADFELARSVDERPSTARSPATN